MSVYIPDHTIFFVLFEGNQSSLCLTGWGSLVIRTLCSCPPHGSLTLQGLVHSWPSGSDLNAIGIPYLLLGIGTIETSPIHFNTHWPRSIDNTNLFSRGSGSVNPGKAGRFLQRLSSCVVGGSFLLLSPWGPSFRVWIFIYDEDSHIGRLITLRTLLFSYF